MVHIQGSEGERKKKYQQDVCMYEYVDAHETRQTIVGEKSLVYIIKWRFLCMNGRFFGITGGQWA